MEYDPASPTDEPEEYSNSVDLSAIPLPECSSLPKPTVANILDIPLPPSQLLTSDIPLPPPPPTAPLPIADPPFIPPVFTTQQVDEPPEKDQTPGPLKFSFRSSKFPTGTDMSNEQTGVFESSKDLKAEETKVMPKLQAMMKRSKPSQLPVGVLPAKLKVPVQEAKTELFLPTKESDVNGSDAVKASAMATPLPSAMTSDNTEPSSSSTKESLTLANNPLQSDSSARSDNVATPQLPTTTSNFTSGTSHIPNLMSLTVQPAQNMTSLGQSASAMINDPTAILRQSKISLTSMQYVNPQKLRSAQMIAMPLIANPAIAAQAHHSDDPNRTRGNRRRSRSRRSRSPRRSSPGRHSRRRRSSSSSSSSPRRSGQRRRRSRSRRSSSGKYSRRRDYSRDRERRGYDRHSEKPIPPETRRGHRTDRPDGRRASRSPSKDMRRINRRSASRDRSRRFGDRKRSPIKEDTRRQREKPKKPCESESRKRKDSESSKTPPHTIKDRSKLTSREKYVDPKRPRPNKSPDRIRQLERSSESETDSCESSNQSQHSSEEERNSNAPKPLKSVSATRASSEENESSGSSDESTGSSSNEQKSKGQARDSKGDPTASVSLKVELVDTAQCKSTGIGKA